MLTFRDILKYTQNTNDFIFSIRVWNFYRMYPPFLSILKIFLLNIFSFSLFNYFLVISSIGIGQIGRIKIKIIFPYHVDRCNAEINSIIVVAGYIGRFFIFNKYFLG